MHRSSLRYEGFSAQKTPYEQDKPQGCGLSCSKGVLGLEINEVIRGITTPLLYIPFYQKSSID
jgi:hypothetical protein